MRFLSKSELIVTIAQAHRTIILPQASAINMSKNEMSKLSCSFGVTILKTEILLKNPFINRNILDFTK